jgi:sugar O-acyltransferase (sialic acid O-acetyltransferase NeuD family)
MNNKEKIILLGGGGHCKAVIDVLELENKYEIVGIVDPEIIDTILGYPVLGNDNDLPELITKYKNVVITVGQIKSSTIRSKLFDLVKNLGGHFPIIISPKSHVSTHASIQEGTVIMHNVVVNSGAEIGVNNIINTGSIIEHDSVVGDFSHISTKAVLNGGSKIGNHCFVGSGSIINENKIISSNCVIGSGSVVTQSILNSGIYAGVPCKKIS